jgi:hypothetical protein
MFVEVREPQTQKLLFKFDPSRDIIEVQRRGVKTLVDLREYREQENKPQENADERQREGKPGSRCID